jgi:hypothetical protein
MKCRIDGCFGMRVAKTGETDNGTSCGLTRCWLFGLCQKKTRLVNGSRPEASHAWLRGQDLKRAQSVSASVLTKQKRRETRVFRSPLCLNVSRHVSLMVCKWYATTRFVSNKMGPPVRKHRRARATRKV